MMYEVYLEDYPTVKTSMQTAYIQTIEDICTSANGLTLTSVAGANPDIYFFDGTLISVLNTFTQSNAGCPIIRYECSLDGVSMVCDYDDFAGTVSTFDVSTGEFTYSSTNKDNAKFLQGTTVDMIITAFTGTAGDVNESVTTNIEFSCMVEIEDFVWTVPVTVD